MSNGQGQAGHAETSAGRFGETTGAVNWSIRVLDTVTDEIVFDESAEKPLSTASIGKVLLLFRVAELLERGSLDIGDMLTRTPSDRVADSGVWQYLLTDSLPVGDLCELVGSVSDNLATNVLLRTVGLAGVAETADGLGMKITALHDRVRDLRGPEDAATLSTGTAAELVHLMSQLHRAALAGSRVADRVRGWLSKGTDLSQVAAGWGLDPLSHLDIDRGLSLINKTGTDVGVRAEVGVLTGPAGSIAYAVIANWAGDLQPDRRDEVLARAREVGLSISRLARGVD